jgi:hypothetical protein
VPAGVGLGERQVLVLEELEEALFELAERDLRVAVEDGS